MQETKTSLYLHKFFQSAILAISMTEAFPVAAAIYSITRAGVRFWGYALPGQCTNAVINLSLSTGTCIAAGSWLTTRVSWATSAHAWSWVMYGGFALIVALWQRPQGTFNGWRAFMLVGFTIAVHELFWFFTYFVVHPELADIWINLQIYGAFIAMCGIGIVIFYLLGYQKVIDQRILVVGLLMMTIFYGGWAAIGYPLTLDLKIGITPLFASGWVDFIELCSWLVAFSVVGFSYYAKQVRE